MASISSCTAPFASLNLSTTKTINAPSSPVKLSSRFLGTRVVKLRIRLGPSNGSRATCWFKFGKNGVDAENAGIYGSQSRDDFDRDDVEQVLFFTSKFLNLRKSLNIAFQTANTNTFNEETKVLDMSLWFVDDLQYFNYMGMLAVEGTYDKMEALLKQNIHPVDILLMLAASEGDKPKIEELLRAGANYTVKDADGRTALDRANSEEIRDLILGSLTQKA